MTVPPLFDHFDSEDEDQLPRDTASREAGREADAEHWDTRSRPSGMRARAQAWLHVEPFYWVMRVVYVCLVAGAVFAVYINGVAEGWWRAWGEKPSVAATAPAAQPTPAPTVSSEAAMSGGYQIGPDGVLVRPAQYAADTYTKPELPDEAKENTERGAELAAEHFLALENYAWNTGDVQPLADISEPGDNFSGSYITAIKQVYSNGWAYGNNATITEIVTVEPVSAEQWGAQKDTIGVLFHIRSTDGVTCIGQKILSNEIEYDSSLALFVTWKGDRWIITGGSVDRVNKQ